MTLPMFSPALDTTAVEAMVSKVGSYTLESLRNSELRAKQKQKCAERLKITDAPGRTVQYADQAILANLEWGIESLEEAITTNNDETKVARLDHAEKMLQVCALLDTRVATAGVSNCYLSAWAHFNLAFVWKLRDNDRKAANHMLEMFLVDPFFSRVDFAPALWENLFLPHLSNIVNWYTKQRKSVVLSGTVRKMTEEQEMSSFDVSRDFTSNSPGVLQQELSPGQTSQLEALENLFQESLDENTRQYARYYKDWVNSDLANKKGMPLMPIPEPPMTPNGEPWVPSPIAEVPSSGEITMPVEEPILHGQVTESSTSSFKDLDSAVPPRQESNQFNYPEVGELAKLPTVIAAHGLLDDDPDSPNSNFRRPGWQHPQLEPTASSSYRQSESAEDMIIRSSTAQSTPSSAKFSRSSLNSPSDFESSFGFSTPTPPSIHKSNEISAGPPFGSVPVSRDIKSVPSQGLGDIESVASPGETRSAHTSGDFGSVSNNEELVPNLADIRSVPNSGQIRSGPSTRDMRTDSGSETLGDSLEMRVPLTSRTFRQQPDARDYFPADAERTPTADNGKLSELRDTFPSPKTSHVNHRGRTGRKAYTLNNSPGSRNSDPESMDRKLDSIRAELQPGFEEFDSDQRHHTSVMLQKTEGFNQSSNDSSNEDLFKASNSIWVDAHYSFNDLSDSEASGPLQIQDLKLEHGQNRSRDARASGNSSATRFLSKHGSDGFAGSTPSSRWYQNDDDEPIIARSGSLLERASERNHDDDDEPILARSGPLLGRASQRYHNGDNEPIVARSGRQVKRVPERYPDDYDEPIRDWSGPLLGSSDDDEPIVARPGSLRRSLSERYTDGNDKQISKTPRSRSGPLRGMASQRNQDGVDNPVVARRSGRFGGRASNGYRDEHDKPYRAWSGPMLGSFDDNEPIVARPGPILRSASQRYDDDDDKPISQPIRTRSGPLRGMASQRNQNGDDDPIGVRRSGRLGGRTVEGYRDDDDQPPRAWSGPLLGNYQDDDDEPIAARPGPLRRSASQRYDNDDDKPISKPIRTRSGPLRGMASQRNQNGDDDPIVVRRSGRLGGRTVEGNWDDDDQPPRVWSGPLLGSYQDDDDEPIAGRSGPTPGRAYDRYQDDDDKPISKPIRTWSGPLRGMSARDDDDDEPIVTRSGSSLGDESVDSGSARGQRRNQRQRRSKSVGRTRNSTLPTPLTRPPKDFVCPITRQLFHDPVTLETGQTYERVAIQEQLNRGNLTCPITRQTLRQSTLPKTNYLLKRLVDSWKERHPKLAKEFDSSPLPPSDATATVKPSSGFTEMSEASNNVINSPGSSRRNSPLKDNIISDVSRPDNPVKDLDGFITDLQPAVSSLCTSENLADCEKVMVEIGRLILQARGDQRLVSTLNRPGAIAGMMKILFNSQDATVLNATLFLLSVVLTADDTARQIVTRADPQLGCLVGLVRKGMVLSASVLYQLKLPKDQLAALDLFPLFVMMIKENEEKQGVDASNEQQDIYSIIMRPRSAAIMLLDQILTGAEPTTFSKNSQLLALQAIPALIFSLNKIENMDVRTSSISLLLCCIQSDGRSRNMIAERTDLVKVVDILHSGSNKARKVAITFLNELVRLSRRTLCTDILQQLKTTGSRSSMRVLLVYLQMAPLEHRPMAASLLLQLDLLQEPRKGSMYREEAVDSLVKALTSSDRPCPVEAAKALIALGGRFSSSGDPMLKAWLLKISGIDKYFLSLTKNEQDSKEKSSAYDQEEENRAATAWERKMAGALIGHDSGTLIEALGQGIQSKNPEVSKPCVTVAAWLTHMLPKLADTGIRQIARNYLLDHFVGLLNTSKDLRQRVLAALAIHSFISDPKGVQELLSYAKDISGTLRQMNKSTWTAKEILRAFITHGDADSPDLWVHTEQGQLDVTANGEVRALAKAKGLIFSGHSDGAIKIWEVKKRFPVLLRELKEHSKSVMALTVSLNSNRMYSGSLDKSIRVWAIGAEDIHTVHVFHLKDAVLGLLVNEPMACIIQHGAGVKVQYEESPTKTLNSNKHVQSLAVSDGKILCGCTDNSIQELDPISESVDIIQHGVRTLMGKKPVYAIQVFQDHLYTAGALVDGVAGKVWKLSDRSLVNTICTPFEMRAMAINEDFIYLGSHSGVIQVWLRERLVRVATFNPGNKVICLMLDGDTLYSGHEDGKIRIWTRT